jgi:hypothetical protein
LKVARAAKAPHSEFVFEKALPLREKGNILIQELERQFPSLGKIGSPEFSKDQVKAARKNQEYLKLEMGEEGYKSLKNILEKLMESVDNMTMSYIIARAYR